MKTRSPRECRSEKAGIWSDFEGFANQNSDTPTGSASDLDLELGPHRILFGNYFKLNYAPKYDKPLFPTHTAETISIHKVRSVRNTKGGEQRKL